MQPKKPMQHVFEDRSIPFLMHLIVTRVEALTNRWARPLGLRIEGVRVLFRLLHREHSVNDLARMTGIEISTLSRLLGRMERQGLLTRRRDPGDGRTVIVALTPEGLRLARQHQPVYFRDYEKILLESFSPGESSALRDMLMRMIDNLAASDEEKDPRPATPPPRLASG